MADSGSGIGQFTDEIEQAAGEVVEEVRDSVGEAVEQGVQSVVGIQLTPQQIQQKQQQDQEEITKTRKKLSYYQDLKASLNKEAQAAKQKEAQRLQAQQQEAQTKKNERAQIQVSSKKPGAALTQSEEIARTRQEVGKGHGIGG